MKKALGIYLNFDGNARQAMGFYESCLGGELFVMTFAESPMPAAPGAENRLVHARLSNDKLELMASDTMPGMPFHQGNNFYLSLDCESQAELDKLFAALGAGGKVIMPPQETFWAKSFGMLTDKFGVSWMFNIAKPMEG